MRKTPIVVGISLALAVGVAQAADAQGFGDRLKKRAEEAAKRKVEQRTEQRTGEAVDKALTKVENAVKCAATDQKCIDDAKAQGKNVVLTDEKGNVAGGAGGADAGAASGGAAAKLKPGEGAWVNYDFVPGTRALFVDDFGKDNVGDFPRRLEFIDGNMEVAEWQGARYLRVTSWPGKFTITLPEKLPERFTMEFDAALGGDYLTLAFADDAKDYVKFSQNGSRGHGGVIGPTKQSMGQAVNPIEEGQLFRARIMADGRYVKLYMNDTRVANIPNAELGSSNKINFAVTGTVNEPAFIGNISIMAGGKKLYDALAEAGRVATQGIYFDTGSDRIRPESSPTLKEIGQMLKEHADLKLTIEGHTDNVGSAAANQKLSEMRAEAVKQFLVSEYGIEESRLTAKGLGATKPVASNDTAEGRQNNRRVELVKG